MRVFTKSTAIVLTGMLVITDAIVLPLCNRCLAKAARGETWCVMRQ